MDNYNTDDVIVAQATPPGASALAIIRISGSNLKNLFTELTKINKIKDRFLYTCNIYKKNSNGLLDKCMAVYLSGPKSFTGEDIIEITCHGSKYIIDEIITEICIYGARIASPGEFSYRALINGKINLSQAESIQEIIESNTKLIKDESLLNNQGKLTDTINNILRKTSNLLTHIEHELDFNENEITHINKKYINNEITEIAKQIKDVLDSVPYSKIIKDGINIAIIGKPNAGKSTLFNALLGQYRSIVSEQEKTTRNSVEVHYEINGIDACLIDTAGYVKTSNKIDEESVKRTMVVIKKSDIIIVLDKKNPKSAIKKLLPKNKHILYVKSKYDINKIYEENFINISAKTGYGMKEFSTELQTTINSIIYKNRNDRIYINKRQVELIKQAYKILEEAQNQIKNNQIMTDILATYLHSFNDQITQINNQGSREEIINNIFSGFCVGK